MTSKVLKNQLNSIEPLECSTELRNNQGQ